MKRTKKPRTAPGPTHPTNSDVIAVWALRVLLRPGGLAQWRQQRRFVDPGTAQILGVGACWNRWQELPASEVDGAIHSDCERALRALEREKPRFDGPLGDNLAMLQEHLALSPAEIALLAYAVVRTTNPIADTLFGEIEGTMDPNRLPGLLAVALGVSPEAMAAAMSPSGTLMQAGLLTLEPVILGGQRLEPLAGMAQQFMVPQANPGELFRVIFHQAPPAQLESGAFEHLRRDYSLIADYLRSALAEGLRGVNILLYGPAGTGKTALVRTLAGDLGVTLNEVTTEAEDGSPPRGCQRLSAYRLSQRILSRKPASLLLFDEIEDVLRENAWNSLTRSGKYKSWMHSLLADNAVPAIWISNRVWDLDPALIRRFDLVLEIKPPTRRVRRALLQQSMATLGVGEDCLERLADQDGLNPALIERARRVIQRLPGQRDGGRASAAEQVLKGTMTAMGLRSPGSHRSQRPATNFDLTCLNTDRDLGSIIAGLKTNPTARLCLYGPPGTGKTAFGRELAQALDYPLHVKRASDLLGRFVGETEEKIAAMFEEAQTEGAVLLLDEADSFLQDRRRAGQSWEITQVNELLTQMESFDGVFVATTNLVASLDPASLRRFDLKVAFEYLKPAQALRMAGKVLDSAGAPAALDGELGDRLARLPNLAAGDFATVLRQTRITGVALTPTGLVAALENECRMKPDAPPRSIGFRSGME